MAGNVRLTDPYGIHASPPLLAHPDGAEVDLLCETRDGFVAVEVKASKRWDRRYNRGLTRIRDELGANRVTCYGGYAGERPGQVVR